jgi:streptogramin lyase
MGIEEFDGTPSCLSNWTPLVVPGSLALGCPIAQVATGGDGVWIIYIANGVGNDVVGHLDFQQGRFVSFSLTSPAVQIAVGSGAGVWAIDSSKRVYTFERP